MSNENKNNHNDDFNFDANPSWFLIQWLRRLCEEELRENFANAMSNRIIQVVNAGNNNENVVNDSSMASEEVIGEIIEIDDDSSTISEAIVGNDEFLNHGVSSQENNEAENNRGNDDLMNGENNRGNNNLMNGENESNRGNDNLMNGENNSENESNRNNDENNDRRSIDSDIRYYDYDREVIFNLTANPDGIVDAFNVHEYLGVDDSDDDTEIFDFNEYQQAQQQERLVDYSDTESNDSFFSKTEEPATEPTNQPICPICLRNLSNRQPRFIDTCGHFACLECMKGLFRNNRNVRCFLCRVPIPSKRNCRRSYIL